ncbi:MAG: cell division protein SepF [Oscillospiraceae bacterium]|nr:cell division protein SepF [Oscillospiraceae bacterium]MBP5239615.1 cell division protein SepF [Oscillospiraceae bacterium]
MGFMDELRKLTQPYEDEDDFYEGADASAQPSIPSDAQLEFENAFGGTEIPERADDDVDSSSATQPEGGKGIFSGLGRKKPVRPRLAREKTVEFAGTEQQVILFNPKSFDEAGDLVQHLTQGRSIVMTLEGVPTDLARRLLDFLSGIAYALQGKITPISAKTYFVTPQNVDVLGAEELSSNQAASST